MQESDMQESEKDRVLSNDERQEVMQALEAILATDKFEAAPQMSAFLRYVVEQAADGNQSRIKAFTVAVDALGKPDSFDPQNDPVVRVLAGRLRAALAAYNDENPDAVVVITMTPGSYVPSFERRDANSTKARQLSPVLVDTLNERPNPYDDKRDGKASASTVADIVNPPPFVKTDLLNDPGVETKPNPGTSTDDIERENFKSSPIIASVNEALVKLPRLAIAAAIAAAIVFGLLQERFSSSEPEILAATKEPGRDLSTRGRPTEPTIFISAIDYGNELENSLNTLVSGVISESEHVNVYRILDSERDIRFWAEDYILTLTAVQESDETQINMQLVEARTGRFVHSEVARLDKQAANHLTLVELERITDAARSLVDIDGPVLSDFSARLNED